MPTLLTSFLKFNFANPAWQVAVFWLWALVALAGGIAVVGSLMSAITQYYISDTTERAARSDIDRSKERIAIAEAQMRDADARIASAAASALIANQRAAEASAASEQAKAESAKAIERASGLEKSAEEARQRTTELELQLEHERLERLKLVRSLGPRNLLEFQVTQIESTLSGQKISLLLVTLGDQEANHYAQAIYAPLKRAGLDIRVTSVGQMLPPVYGLIVAGRGKQRDVLVRAFESAGVDVKSVDGGDLTITVGLKPSF